MADEKNKRLKLNEGDVFTIPINDYYIGFGQIVKIPNKHELIVVVFDNRIGKGVKFVVSDLIKKPILYLGFTNDALFFHQRWLVIGNFRENLSSIIMPLFKLDFYPDTKLVNYKLETLRMATLEEDQLLSFQQSNSPIGYQKALQAHFGEGKYELEECFHYNFIVNNLIKLNLLYS